MILRKLLAASALGAALLLPVAAPVAAQSTLRVGAVVTDANGGEVGRIESVDGDHVVLRTDKHQARIPASSFTATADAVLFGMTRDQLNTQLDQAVAQAQAAVTVGATVHDRDGVAIGPIEAVDAESVTVKLGEQQIRLPRNAVASGANGLVIGVTLAEVQAQLSAAAGSGAN